MIPYLFYFILVLASGMVYLTNVRNKNKIFIILFFVISFSLMALRSESVGTDTYAYCYNYENTISQPFNSIFDAHKNSYVFVLIEYIISIFGKNGQAYIIGTSFIINLLSCAFLYRYCKEHLFYSTLLYILFYYFFISFNISRQFIALLFVSNFLFLLDKRTKKNFIFFCIVLTIGFMIHNTAIFMVCLLPLFFIDKFSWKILYSIVSIVTLFLILENISFFSKLSIFEDYLYYFDSDSKFNIDQNSQGRSLMIYVPFIILIIFYFIFDKSALNENGSILTMNGMNKNLFCVFLIYVLFGMLFYNNLLFSRITYYFALSSLIVIPRIFNCLSSKEQIIYKFSIVCVYLIPFSIMFINGYAGIIPYDFFIK